jgi:hypothetical protein
MATKRTTTTPATTAKPKAEPAAARRARLRAHAESQIEEYLRANGVEEPASLQSKEGYEVEAGDVTLFIGFEPDGRDVLLLVGAELMGVPANPKRAASTMRELLELNAMAIGPARFAIEDGSVWVVSVDRLDLMPDADYGRCIDAVAGWANQALEILSKKPRRVAAKRR